MPFYEYQCRACGAEVEVLQKITDAPLKKCPECGRNQLAKLVSAPVFRLKGGGWYETDFKTDKDSKRNLVDSDGDKGEKKPDDKAEAKPDAKPEARPEAKTEPKPEPKPEVKTPPKPAARPVRKKSAVRAKAKTRR